MSDLFDKPIALSIGPQECGTKQLEQYFRGRSDVCLPNDVSEIFFFDRHYQRGSEFYASHFDPKEDQSLVMELTTTAFDSVEASDNVYELFEREALLFCPLRHPVYRSYDVYQEYLSYGIVSGGIENAVEQAPQILHSSRYAEHLEPWFKRFGQSSIKIMFYEDYLSNEALYISDLCAYLSIPYVDVSSSVNKAKIQNKESLPGFIKEFVKGFQVTKEDILQPPSTKSQTIEWLFDRMLDDIKKSEDLLGHSFPAIEEY